MSQYFENVNLKSNIIKHEINIYDKIFRFYTDNGVFSKKGLDFGTRSLLEAIPVYEFKGKILDVGCGYGAIGIILSSLVNIEYEGIDINKRAIHLANMNARENNCSNLKFYESDCYSNVNDKYDYIITNPPIRAGKHIVYQILIGAKEYLKKEGELYFVMRKEHGLKSCLKDIESYYKTSVIKKNKGFYIIKCILR